MEGSLLLTSLNVQASDRIISVHENGLSDSNFIITNLMKKILSENGKICLVIVHHTIGHYHNVLKRLGQDFMEKFRNGHATTIEPLKDIATDTNSDFLSSDKELIVKSLFLAINEKINKLLDGYEDGQVYLIIDDLSHLTDLGVDIKFISAFINYCVNLARNDRICLVINCHIADSSDKVISNCLRYVSNLVIDVSPLKTGISHEVTGVITITRPHSNELLLRNSTLHYKAYDREIKTFAPGESIYHLYK